MTDFFEGQMDYILFFYGFSFVMLSAVCFIMAKARMRRLPWVWLGVFGLLHGFHEWLDVFSRGMADAYSLQVVSLFLAFGSFAALAEFGRAGIREIGGKGPGRWVLIPYLALSALGLPYGMSGVEAIGRYAIALPAGLVSSYLLFDLSRREEPRARRWLISGSLSLGLLAASSVVSGNGGRFFSASLLNDANFMATFHLPVELFGGIIVFILAISLWVWSQAQSGEGAGNLRRPRITAMPVVIVVVILCLGLVFTNVAGDREKDEQKEEGLLLADALSRQLSHALDESEATARMKAESPRIVSALLSRGQRETGQAGASLNQCGYLKGPSSPACYLYDAKGSFVVACDAAGKTAGELHPYLRMLPSATGFYDFDDTARTWSYCATAPVRAGSGRLIGTVAVRQNLEGVEALFRKHPYCFLVDPKGRVFLSSSEKYCLKNLWPVGASKDSLLQRIAFDGRYAVFEGRHFLVTRKPAGSDGWSVVLLNSIQDIRAYRLFAIFTTFFFSIMTVIFFSVMYFTRESAARLAASGRELRKAKEGLETRVAERTSELAQVNEQLLVEISERRLSEKALKVSEEKYKNLVELTPDMIYLSDIDGRILFINNACQRILGAAPGEVTGKALQEWIHPADRDVASDRLREIMEQGADVFDFETRFVSSRGGTVNLLHNIRVIKGEKGEVLGTQGIARDVTGKMLAEARLRDSEERFRSLFNLASDSILLMSPGEGELPVIIDANATACRMHGYTREELIGKPISFLDHDESVSQAQERSASVMSGGAVTFEVSHIRKDGTVFPLEVSAQLIVLGGKPYILAIDRDITERKRVEEALREHDRRQKAILNNIPDMAWLKDREGRYIATNESFGRTCGVHPEDIPGTTDFDIWPRHLAEKYRADDMEVIETGRRKQIEEPLIDQEGRRIWIETIKTPICNGAGEVIGTTGIARDITERMHVEEKLRLFSRAIEEAMDGVQIIDAGGRVIYSNRAVEEIYGFTGDELLGRDVNEMNADREFAGAEILPALREKGQWSGEVMVVHKTGRIFPVWLSASVVKNADGETMAMIGIIRDMTERRRSEEELSKHREHLVEMVEERTLELQTAVQFLTQEIGFRKKAEETLKGSEARFRELSQQFNTLLDAIPDTLLLLSPDLKVLWANSAAAVNLGNKTQDLGGKHCYELWHETCTPCEDCHVMKAFVSGEAQLSRRATNGRLFDSKAFPIRDDSGTVVNVILVVSDVTEKTTLEAEAMRASHLASLGELAAGVAHEINNPINGIINYAQIIVNKRGEESREREIAGRIIKEGNRIAGIVRSLLSFARERKEEKGQVSIPKILYDTITLTEAQIRKDGILLNVDVPEYLPTVYANAQQLQQVFLNIISNARYALNRKYNAVGEGKILSVSCERITVRETPHVEITFFDRGSGIPAEILDKIMNPFFSTKPSGEGTGLGLSISHGIVKDHGGRLTVESEEGSFTKVSVHLPAEELHGG